MARVVREKTKVFTGNIGINTTSGTDISNSLNQISSAASNASSAFFKRADEIARQEGLDAAKDLKIDQITTLDINTGKPVALSIPKTWGITRTNAFRDMVDKRFYASIENEIRVKSKEFSQKYKRSGNYLANYRSSMKTYLASMHKESSGQYAEFIKEVGGNTIAATEPNILAYIESKQLSQTKSFIGLERSRLLQVYNTAFDPAKKAAAKKQLEELTEKGIALQLLPKNAKDALSFELSSIDGFNTFRSIIGNSDNTKELSNLQTYLLTNNPSLLNGFGKEKKEQIIEARQSLDNQQVNAINSTANQAKTRINNVQNEFEREQSNLAVENANSIVAKATQIVFDQPINTEGLFLEEFESSLAKAYELVVKEHEFGSTLAFNPSVANRVKTNIRNAQTDRYLASAFALLSDEEERLFTTYGGNNLINNAYYSLPNQRPISSEDQNIYNQLVELSPNFENLFNTVEELSAAGVPTSSITQVFNSRTKNWTQPYTTSEQKKLEIIQNLTENTGKVFDGTTKDYQSAAGDLMQTVYQNSSLVTDAETGQFLGDFINDPRIFDNQEIMDTYGRMLDQGALPIQIINAIKSNNVSETVYKLATIAQQHITYRGNNQLPVVRNVLNNIPGIQTFNEKLYAVNSLLKLGITSGIPDYDSNGKLVEGTGKAIESYTEAFELMNNFDIKDNSPFIDKLNRAAKFAGFKDKGNKSPMQQIYDSIDKILIDEYPTLVNDFRNVAEYMLMVGTKFDENTLKTMIKDYVEINTGSDGIVYDSANVTNPHRSVFALNQIFKQPEIAVAFTKSIESLVNLQYLKAYQNTFFDFEKEELNNNYKKYNSLEDALLNEKLTFFTFKNSEMTDQEAEDIFFKKRVDFNFGEYDDLSDDRFIMRSYTGGAKANLEKKGGKYIFTYDREGSGLLPMEKTLVDYYYQYEGDPALFSTKGSFEKSVGTNFEKQIMSQEIGSSTIQNMFLIPLPNKIGTSLFAEESIFDIQYIVAIKSPGGGLRPLINPNDGSSFMIDPKDFKNAVETFDESYKKAILTPGEKEAYKLNKLNADNPDFQKPVTLREDIVDKTIKFNLKAFEFLNNGIHGYPFDSTTVPNIGIKK